jgi:hypothetical protein
MTVAEPNNQKTASEKLDHLFEIGLILITVLSAQELQYASTLYSGQSNEIAFVFRILSIPILMIILLWLIKELFPQKIRSLSLRRWIKEFCWDSLSVFIAVEIISFAVLGFPELAKNINIFQSLSLFLAIFGVILTFPVTWKYRAFEIKVENEKKAKVRFIGDTLIEHIILYWIAYGVLVVIVLICLKF